MKKNRNIRMHINFFGTFLVVLIATTLSVGSLFAQERAISTISEAVKIPDNLDDSLFSTYYQQKVSHFRTLPIHPGKIIFLGNSITDGAEWAELFGNNQIINRGISGDKTAGILNRLDEITQRKPSKVFLLIGTNDLEHNVSQEEITDNIFLISQIIESHSPGTQLYIQSILPVNDFYQKFNNHTKNGKAIVQINSVLSENASKYNYTYIDIHQSFTDAEGKLKKEFTNDGLHLNGQAYQAWKELISPFVNKE